MPEPVTVLCELFGAVGAFVRPQGVLGMLKLVSFEIRPAVKGIAALVAFEALGLLDDFHVVIGLNHCTR